jgi:hypothetical protein
MDVMVHFAFVVIATTALLVETIHQHDNFIAPYVLSIVLGCLYATFECIQCTHHPNKKLSKWVIVTDLCITVAVSISIYALSVGNDHTTRTLPIGVFCIHIQGEMFRYVYTHHTNPCSYKYYINT